jgi:hypothetical protein
LTLKGKTGQNRSRAVWLPQEELRQARGFRGEIRERRELQKGRFDSMALLSRKLEMKTIAWRI